MYVAIRRVKANKLFNKKLYSWPKYAIFVYKDTITPFQCEPPTIHSSSIEKENTFLNGNGLYCQISIYWRKTIYTFYMCDCQSLWVIDDFGGMPAEP